MLPHQFKRLLEAVHSGIASLRSELNEIKKSFDEQIQADTEHHKSSESHWREVPRIVIEAIRPTQHEVAQAQANYDQTYRQQERAISVQRGLRTATWFAFGAATAAAVGAFVYAAIAAQQRDTMNKTLCELQKQTPAVIQSGNAAESAAKTAKETLWAAEGANVYTDAPQFNTGPHRGRIIINNSGHMASGPAVITVHVATSEVDPKTTGNKLLEYHWSTKGVDSIPLGSNYTVWLYLPQLTPFGLNDGTRMVLVGGSIEYSIGIGGAPKRKWPFCYIVQNMGAPTPCDPVVVDSWKVSYGYPAHKEPFPEERNIWPVRTP